MRTSSPKRDELAARTYGGRVIHGSCGQDVSTAPSFGCSSGSDVDKFSLSSFDVITEFDCLLEFHYDMPDGSVCKESHQCSKEGTTITNTSCGGAKKVHFVFPEQGTYKKSCGVGLHNVQFHCSSSQTTSMTAQDYPVPTYSEPVLLSPYVFCTGLLCPY